MESESKLKRKHKDIATPTTTPVKSTESKEDSDSDGLSDIDVEAMIADFKERKRLKSLGLKPERTPKRSKK